MADKLTPSQPSPTNLSDELDKLLHRVNAAGALDGNNGGEDWSLSDAEIATAKAAITAAYAEAINEIIGEDEVEYSNLDGNAGYWEKHGRNGLRAEQRQRLKATLHPTKLSGVGEADGEEL